MSRLSQNVFLYQQIPWQKVMKLVSVSVICVSITVASTKVNLMVLKVQQVSCIQYPMQFSQHLIEAPIDSDSKVNVMQPSFTRKLGLYTHKTDIGAQKIDYSRLKNFGMINTSFLIEIKNKRSHFFEKTLL